MYFCIEIFTPSRVSGLSRSEIVVNEDKLKAYLQFQRKSFNKSQSEQLFRTMPVDEKQALTQSYIRDEALFREALSLGLNDNDEIIRRRLIQKMEYLAQGFYDDIPVINEEDLNNYFLANRDQYKVDESISFTHVFVSFKKNPDTQKTSRSLLTQLNRNTVTADQAGAYGDRYLYNRNYIERTSDYITSHFGKGFQDAVFKLAPGKSWQGPIQSDYGVHLVLITRKSASRLPELSEVAEQVLADAQRERQRKAKAEAIQNIVDKYKVSST